MPNSANALDIGDLSFFALSTIQKIGQEALQFYGKGRRRPPFDQDLVTQAELHLNDLFQQQLGMRFADHQIYGAGPLSEGYTHGAKRYLWIFDPLDGVDNFQIGIPIWGMSLALYENHWPVLGIFYMPATNDLFRAQAGREAYWNDRPIRTVDSGDLSQESIVLTYSRFHQHYSCRFPGKIRCLGSTVAHACYVAMGRANAAIIANGTFKDLAAVRVIVEAAGAKLYKADGSVFFLGDYTDGRRIEDHLIIAGPRYARPVLNCLTRL
ncbi:MAG: inositol monophosphatase [Desulfobacteraceae bacterium]|nr:MAG: inositol monophosphatase [Desulfobacteraceae bacterium]